MKTSLLISTYNRPKSLRVCLESVRRQSKLPDEIIIADDGSKEETRNFIAEISKNFPVPIFHVWQPDEGFRKAIILNKAVAKTNADFIIQIDGDVFLHPKYIEDFISIARKGYCILGSRVSLSKGRSEEIENSTNLPSFHPWSKGIIQKRFRTLYFKLGRKISRMSFLVNKKNKSQGLGCSLAFWREDYIKINGNDEDFIGWGCEDRDFIIRLGRAGVLNHRIQFIGIVYHLWHVEEDRSFHQANRTLCYTKKDIVCIKGISQYL